MSYLNLPNRESYCYGRELSGDIHSTAKVLEDLGLRTKNNNVARIFKEPWPLYIPLHRVASDPGRKQENGFQDRGPELYSRRDFNNGPSSECRNPISCPCMQMMVILLREFPDCVVEFMLIMMGWFMFVYEYD